MKNRSFFACLIAVLAMSIISIHSSGQDNNTNGDNVDMKFVRFDMTIDPGLSSTNVMVLNGAVTHYFTTKIANVQTVKFDFYRDNTSTPLRLIGDSIRYHGIKYTGASRINHVADTLIINLPSPIAAAGALDSVTIYYHGNPPQSSGSRGYKKNTIAGSSPTGIISTHSSGFFARQWWPCKHNMTDKIDSAEFLIKAPSAYTAVANGLLLNGPTPPIVGGTDRIWHWKSRYPVAHYLIAMAVHPYARYDSPPANISGTSVPIINFLTGAPGSGTNTTTVKGNCDHMGPVMEHFSTLFGDYPFKNEKYGHVVYTFSGGMENQTASYIGTGSMTNRNLLAHELAHQWWGDKVTCLKWNNIWVNEGFARYSEYLYLEQFGAAGDDVTLRNTKKANGQSTTGTVHRYDVEVVNDATDHTGKIFVSSMVYDKASIVISMLRKLVGDVKFFQALKNYLNDPLISYGFSNTEDVRRHFEAVSGKDLTSFFDDFIYRYGYPNYSNVQWAYSASHKKVGIKLNQTKSAGTNVSHFNTVLPIRLRKTSAPIKDTTIVVYDDGIASANALFFNVSFAVDRIDIDPNSEAYAFNYISNPAQTPALLITLPVNLKHFAANKKESAVNVTWESNDENGFSHYEVEHSADGLSFSKIATVTANGQQAAIKNYGFIHTSPGAGQNYYRLKMIDIDGKYEYSSIATVVMPFSTNVRIVPNPAHDQVKISVPFEVKNDVTVRLINLQGQVQELAGLKTGRDIITIDVKNITAGNYWLELHINGYKITERILIQH